MGDWSYEEVQKKLNQPSMQETEDADLSGLEDDKIDEDEDLEPEAEAEEKEVPEKEPPAVPGTSAPGMESMSPKDKQAIREDIIQRIGGDTILKVKGVERRAADLSPDELVMHLQKGMRADQIFQEQAAARRQLVEERAALEQNARYVQSVLEQNQAKKQSGPISQIPEYLKPSADDTQETLAWKREQVGMIDRLNTLESFIANVTDNAQVKKIEDEVTNTAKEYPMASIDECLAIKSVRPNMNTEELVRASHNYYSGLPFIEKAFQANPTAKREYDAKVIQNYLAGKQNVRRMPGTKRVPANVDKVSGKPPRVTVRDFNDADNLSRQYIRELNRLEKEG